MHSEMKAGRILIRNAEEIVSPTGTKAVDLNSADEVNITRRSSILISNSRVEGIDVRHGSTDADLIIDAEGCVVLPGLIDPHTHMIFAGTREDEFYRRLHGESYTDIARSGGGILRTARYTSEAGADQIYRQTMERVRSSVMNGITTLEMKTGYSLDLNTEVKMSSVAEMVRSTGIVNVATTFLGLHFVPNGFTSEEFTEKVISEFLPVMSERASFADVFCDSGAFSPEESLRFLRASKSRGMKLKVHADEIENIGSLDMLSGLGLTSADHLINSTVDQLSALAKNGSVGVVLPITSFYLDPAKMPVADRFMKAGLPVALGTDCSPATYAPNMIFAIYLAVRFCGFSINQALTASTLNAAIAVGMEGRGTIAENSHADLIVVKANSYREIPYKFGSDMVKDVVVNGRPVVKDWNLISEPI
ncbi:MAG: imidazolonepropionase [Candidatus Thermoplasmatota archaeon]|nr:imidazolonepropionase [Candidatus Thermoplasmatota archaeon]MCL5731473.1 imidazolonepropionase [Candidatus Thermoplasmatota archaeon]